MITTSILDKPVTLVAGDKIRFHVKSIGLFVGYVKMTTKEAVSLKGCRLLNADDNAYKMNKLDISDYRNKHTHSFAQEDITQVEVLEKSPF